MDYKLEHFPLQLDLRIDWSEMDVFGHVNNVMYMKYLQASRVNYWEKSGVDVLFRASGVGPALASTSCQFRKPLYYPGNIRIGARIEFVKNSSFGIHHHIYNANGDLCAVGNDVIVLFDYSKNEKFLLTPEMVGRMEEIEGRKLR